MNAFCSAWLLAIAMTACAQTKPAVPVRAPLEERDVTLRVVAATDFRTAVAGAEVSSVTDTGALVTIGETDTSGTITVPSEVVAHSRAVLICHPLFNCGALRFEDLSGFRERLLALAPVVVR